MAESSAVLSVADVNSTAALGVVAMNLAVDDVVSYC